MACITCNKSLRFQAHQFGEYLHKPVRLLVVQILVMVAIARKYREAELMLTVSQNTALRNIQCYLKCSQLLKMLTTLKMLKTVENVS